MNTLSKKQKAIRIFYLLRGRNPKKNEKLSLEDLLFFVGLSSELSNWAISEVLKNGK